MFCLKGLNLILRFEKFKIEIQFLLSHFMSTHLRHKELYITRTYHKNQHNSKTECRSIQARFTYMRAVM